MNLLRASAVLLCCVLGGCATVNRMAFDKNASSVDVSQKSVVLMTIDVSRPDKSRFEPVPFVVNVEKPNAQSKQERQNFKLDKKLDSIQTADGHTLFLARMALQPGPYKLVAMMGQAKAFPILGTFQVPLVTELDVKPSSVVYVGRITATLRPRQPGEFRAGPVIPLIDQAVAGLSNGTWDVKFEDRSDTDLPLFQQNFKAVEIASVVKSPLAPFDRAAAQRWWDNSSPKDKEESAETTASTGATAGASN